MQPNRSQRSPYTSTAPRGGGGSGGSSKLMLLGFAALVVFGLMYGAMYIQALTFKSKLDGALGEKVMHTVQYSLLNAANVKQRVAVVKRMLKLEQLDAYVTIQSKDDFSTHGSYYQNVVLEGFQNAQNMRSDKVPGCSNVDALPAGTTAKSLASSSAAGKGSMMNRAAAAAAKDGKALITGAKPTTSAPEGSLIFALDVKLTFRFLVFKRKMWFHRRCYFYPERRRHATVNEIGPVLTGTK